MNELIFKVFYQNDILFIYNSCDYMSSSVINMMKSFDLFYFKSDYLWYRLKKNINIIDKYNKLQPYCEEVNVIRLFENEIPINDIKTKTWVFEDIFYEKRDQGRLNDIIKNL